MRSPKGLKHHNDAREFRSLPLRDLLCFLGSIAPLHGRSDVEKNVAAASFCEGSSSQKLRSARPESAALFIAGTRSSA
jgi:hypothetical protein